MHHASENDCIAHNNTCVQPGERFWSTRLAQRWSNSACILNAALKVRVVERGWADMGEEEEEEAIEEEGKRKFCMEM